MTRKEQTTDKPLLIPSPHSSAVISDAVNMPTGGRKSAYIPMRDRTSLEKQIIVAACFFIFPYFSVATTVHGESSILMPLMYTSM